MLCSYECPKQTTILIPFTAELQTIIKEYWERLFGLEGDKYDLERNQKLKQFEVKFLPIFRNWFLILLYNHIFFARHFSFARVSFVGCEIITYDMIHYTFRRTQTKKFEADALKK
jgi:hypothetical protein